MATVKNNGKGVKVIVFKYKSKVRYRRKNGHRQLFTRLNIDQILPAGVEETRPTKKAVPKKETATEKPAAAVPVEQAVAKETPAKKTATKKSTVEAKPTVKRTPRKKTEEKTDGA
jgi:large subunit ribosomal protein L21